MAWAITQAQQYPEPEPPVDWRTAFSRSFMGLGLLALGACTLAPFEPTAKPRARPVGLAAKPVPLKPSAESLALARFYGRMQADLLTQGLLRTGGGGVDTPYSDRDLARNFERIAFFDEYARDQGLKKSDGISGRLRKWKGPVRIGVEFGASVPREQQAVDRLQIAKYASRLARITGHPISANSRTPNFHVFIMSEDDRQFARQRAAQIIPSISPASLDFFSDLPRSILCFVITAGSEQDYEYTRAIAFIRAEHPPLMRQSCVHEELAQGLGLANDSPSARPSIFNDDDEFALLTTHDEELLRLLYNPALRPGMTADEARPVFRRLIAARHGGPS
nr:DUF2927 domain-containing protein [Roseovarius aestuarii]